MAMTELELSARAYDRILKVARTMADFGPAGLKGLQTLILYNNTKVTDAGLKELAGLNNLQTLELAFTGVSDAGLKHLAGLKSLQSLNLRKTPVTDAGVKELQKALPACSLQH